MYTMTGLTFLSAMPFPGDAGSGLTGGPSAAITHGFQSSSGSVEGVAAGTLRIGLAAGSGAR